MPIKLTNYILLVLIIPFISCNNPADKGNYKLSSDSTISQQLDSKMHNDAERISYPKINGINSYLSNDSLTVLNPDNTEVLQYYLPLSKIDTLVKISIDSSTCSIQESAKDGFLFISVYISDAAPFKSVLVDFQNSEIIIDDDMFQEYLGISENGKYHLFEGGTVGSVRNFGIYNSNNRLLFKSGYYTGCIDTLKWYKNKLNFYTDLKDESSTKEIIYDSKTSTQYVQKYVWENETVVPHNEFKRVFIE